MGERDVKVLFGLRVRQLRKQRGWSQEEFALHAGLDRSYVGGVERGERNISLENICRIATRLGVATSALFEAWDGTSQDVGGESSKGRRSGRRG